MIINIEYQLRAIEQLIQAVSELVFKEGNNICVFQAPTGSGKTVIMAKFIEGLIKDNGDMDFCFLWVSIGKGELQIQSKNKLEQIFDGFPKCVLLENAYFGSRKYIEQNEVVVVNWEKLRSKDGASGDWKNKIMKPGDGSNFIEVIESTKQRRKIILIIDESHYASDALRTNELREIINADITIEMSATPKLQPTAQDIAKGKAKYIYIDPKDVIDAGMIKKELIINEGIDEIVNDEITSQDLILEAAFNKRLELKQEFLKIGSDINPLTLIQLPNSDSGEQKRASIEIFLAQKGVSQDNHKLAIWLSNDKSSFLSSISEMNNVVEFLIFKQAIDTGWDCPRAHILVKLRETQSFTFEIQTVGRILRMPEQKHYKEEKLNIGYIYTNLSKITVAKEEYNPNIIKHLKSIRKNLYQPLELPSYYKTRVDYGDITSSFYLILEEVFCSTFDIELNSPFVNYAENNAKLKKKGFRTNTKAYQEKLLKNKKLNTETFDEIVGLLNKDIDGTVNVNISDPDLYNTFNEFLKSNLNGFAPKRSLSTVRESIYSWFKKYLGIKLNEGGLISIQNLILSLENKEKFGVLLCKAIENYIPIKKEEVKRKIEESHYMWDIKKEEFFNQHTDVKLEYKLCIYEPCYLFNDRSTPEKIFEKYLEAKVDRVEWWFKNGSSKKDFFGIKYMENEFPQTFYPDYIVKLKSGKILIADTKAGITATEATLKAKALFNYIKKYRLSKNLLGGIVILDPTNKWRIHQQINYKYDKHDLTHWDFLDEVLN